MGKTGAHVDGDKSWCENSGERPWARSLSRSGAVVPFVQGSVWVRALSLTKWG